MSQTSSGATLADYRAALSAPGSRGPVIASMLARMPIAMIGMSALLYVQLRTGSFAAAGLVSAAALVGTALGSVAQGRLMDRLGPTRPALTATAVFTVAIVALTAAIEAQATTATMVGLAALAGLSQPTIASASRALWTRLLPAGPARQAAYSYEAISMEVFFVLGPGLSGLLVLAPWPGTGLALGAACMITGSLAFALHPTVRGWPGEPAAGGRMLGALASPGMRTLALAVFGFGIVIGFSEVAVPAAAAEHGSPAVGGALLSAWSVSSVVFGLVYSLRPWPLAMGRRLPALLGGFGALITLLALPSSLWGLALAMLLAGALIAPQATAHSSAIELVAPGGTAAEAFGWVLTGVTLGIATGQSLSGQLVEAVGPRASFLAAGAAAVALAAAVWARRGTVRPVEEPAPREPALAAC